MYFESRENRICWDTIWGEMRAKKQGWLPVLTGNTEDRAAAATYCDGENCSRLDGGDRKILLRGWGCDCPGRGRRGGALTETIGLWNLSSFLPSHCEGRWEVGSLGAPQHWVTKAYFLSCCWSCRNLAREAMILGPLGVLDSPLPSSRWIISDYSFLYWIKKTNNKHVLYFGDSESNYLNSRFYSWMIITSKTAKLLIFFWYIHLLWMQSDLDKKHIINACISLKWIKVRIQWRINKSLISFRSICLLLSGIQIRIF